jgi:ubiquitin carboxyl-terminal hydrolase 22/27/51
VLQAAKLLTEGPEYAPVGRPKKKAKLPFESKENNNFDSRFPNGKYACTHCSISGNKEEKLFRDHFKGTSSHSVVVDMALRELYCMHCQDYQYHHLFDSMINHCRPGKDFMHQRRKIPLGIINMGSTCFMSSVLQLLISSPALIRFFEISECFVVKCKINEVEKVTGKNNMLCIFCELQKVFLSSNSSGNR